MKKNFKPTKNMIEAAKAVFLAMAWKETVKPIVKGYEAKILKKYQFHIASEWLERDETEKDRIILDPEQAYLLNENDFQIYCKECNEERIKSGLKVDNPEHCPYLIADTKLIQAEHLLIKTMQSIYGEDITVDNLLCAGIDIYHEFIELSLKLLAPFVKIKKGELQNA